MFNDFKKMNILSFYITIIAFVINLIPTAFIIILYKLKPKTDPLTLYYNYGFMISMILIIAIVAYIVFMIKATTGQKREILLMYRGRNYYLKMQMALVISYGILSTMLLMVRIYLDKFLLAKIADMEIGKFYSILSLNMYKYAILLFIIVAIIYYFMIYVYDIFYNTANRYREFKVRLGYSALFIVRVLVIVNASFIFFYHYIFMGIDWYSPLRVFLFEPAINSYLEPIILPLGCMMVCLIIDYMCHFKKKVII